MSDIIKTKEQLSTEIRGLRLEIARLQSEKSSAGKLSVVNFMDNFLLGYQSLDENGRFLFVNQSWLDMLGYTQEQVIGRSFTDFLAPGQQQIFETNFPRFKAQGRVRDATFEMICQDNTRLTVSINGQIEHSPSGESLKTHCMLHDITPIKHAKRVLEDSLRHFKLVMDSINAYVFVSDMETYEIVFVNRGAEDAFGKDLLGKACWHEFQAGQTGPCAFCNNKSLFDENGVPVGVVSREVRNTVNGRWYFVQDRAVQWIDGRYMRLEIATDITERKKTEADLQESESRYRQMFESHPSVQWLVDPETQQLVDVNPASAKYYGYSREKMRQMVVSDLNALSSDEIGAKMSQARLKKQHYFEVPHRLASGELRLVEIHAAPIVVKGRELLYAILHDITERKEAETALRHSNRRLAVLNRTAEELNSTLDLDRVLEKILNEVRYLLGAVAGSIWLVEPETNELVCQQATEPQSQIVRGWRMSVYQGVAGWVIRNGRSLNIADAAQDERHFKGVDKHTNLVTRSLLCVPLRLQQRTIGVIEVMDSDPAHFSEDDLSLIENLAGTAAAAIENARLHRQLTEHAAILEKRVAQRTRELVAANQQLKELNQLKTKLIEDISHEMRTPVANLSLYLDLLERGKPEKRDQYMVVLREKMKQLVHLTEDILKVFRLDLFKGEVVFAVLDLNRVVADVVSACQTRLEESGLQFVMAVAQRPLPILAEKKQIEQVITNLLFNATNYTSTGSIQVKTDLMAAQNEACFSIQDSGSGIASEDLPYIFDRFYRGRNAAQFNLPGSGLGLSIVKDVVTWHNGRIEVQSEPGQGSTFCIWLPLATEKPV